MIRLTVYLTPEQKDFLEKTNGIKTSEHIRRAIDEYIQRLKESNISKSPSKGGELT